MNEFALQSSTRAPLAPRISFDVPTSGEPEHSTPRKLACALPFYVDNPDASACKVVGEDVWHMHISGAGVYALGRVRTPPRMTNYLCDPRSAETRYTSSRDVAFFWENSTKQTNTRRSRQLIAPQGACHQ